MQTPSPDLTALLGSRICHDLISPLGAIGNGVELLTMTGEAGGPEIALIAQSVSHANARIRYFRVAFGAAEQGQKVARAEIRSILDDMTRGGRLAIDWQAEGDAPRPDVKLAFLALQCCETAMSYGGRIVVGHDGGLWRVEARAERMRTDPALWSRISGDIGPADLAPAHVQFALLPTEATRQGRHLDVAFADNAITLTF